MAKARAKVLAVEAGQTILLDEAEAVALADRLGITIVALSEGEDSTRMNVDSADQGG
jgi:DUF1009 family protein